MNNIDKKSIVGNYTKITQEIKSFLAGKKILVIALLGVCVLVGLSFTFNNKQTEILSEHLVVPTDISNSVRVFGRAEPEEEYRLGFQVSGKLVSFPFEVGDTVKKGTVLARLDSKTISNRIREATARVAIEASKKSELLAPVRQDELQALESKVFKAQTSLATSETLLQEELSNAAAELQILFNRHIDTYFGTPNRFDRVEVTIDTVDISDNDETDLLAHRNNVLSEILSTRGSTQTEDQLTAIQNIFDSIIGFSRKLEEIARDSRNEVFENEIIADMSELVSNVSSISKSVALKKTTYLLDKDAVLIAKNELNVAGLPAPKESVALQESVINNKKAELNSLYNDLSDYTITSPINGRVFQTFGTLYQTVSAQSPLITIVSSKPLVVRSNIAESDIVYVGIGNIATVTFDALPGESYKAQVSFVEEAINPDQAVSTYETTFQFQDGQDLTKIKSGMTANIVTESGALSDVLAIPASYIQNEGTRLYVWKLDPISGKPQQQEVSLGYETNIGMAQINSGLREGDRIVILK